MFINLKNKKGNMLMTLMVIMPLALVFIGLVVDIGLLSVANSETQMMADASCLAGAHYAAVPVFNNDENRWDPYIDIDGNVIGKSAKSKAKEILNKNKAYFMAQDTKIKTNPRSHNGVPANKVHALGLFEVDVEAQYKPLIIDRFIAFFKGQPIGTIDIKKESESQVFVK